MTINPNDDYIASLRANWSEALAIHSGRPPKLIDIPADLARNLPEMPHGFALCELLEPELAEAAPFMLKIAGFSFHELPIFRLSEGKIDDVTSLRLYLRELPPRIRGGLATLLRHGVTPQMELHPWREIWPSMEFRCFVRDGQLVGLSQYHKDVYFPDLRRNAREIEEELRAFATSLLGDLHMKNVAMDVYRYQAAANPGWRLLELNPLGATTDKCLFKGVADADYNGQFLYRRAAIAGGES